MREPASREPAWLAALHEIGDPRWIALDEASLLDDARARTGLDDFGGDSFREPLRILLDSIDREARLHFLGRVLARDEIVNLLENRLRITDFRARHPEIGRVSIERPIFITGLPRTGTSILHELFACDPANRIPLAWEVRHPCASGAEDVTAPGLRLERAARAISLWNEIVPEYRTIHELGATVPVECIMITAHEFVSDQLAATNQATAYAAWLATADQRPAYEFHRSMLQLLGWNGTHSRWVLKAPSHLASLDALLATYPDARVIHTHRDPLAVMGSVSSTLAATARIRSHRVDAARLHEWFGGEACAALLGNSERVRAAPAARAARFVDVRYDDLMCDPIATVSAAYDACGLDLGRDAEARMRRYLEAKPKDKHGAHSYRFEETGLDLASERRRFADYLARYGLPEEVR